MFGYNKPTYLPTCIALYSCNVLYGGPGRPAGGGPAEAGADLPGLLPVLAAGADGQLLPPAAAVPGRLRRLLQPHLVQHSLLYQEDAARLIAFPFCSSFSPFLCAFPLRLSFVPFFCAFP